MTGDIGKVMEIPISGFSITTTIFGLIGSIVTGILAKQAEQW